MPRALMRVCGCFAVAISFAVPGCERIGERGDGRFVTTDSSGVTIVTTETPVDEWMLEPEPAFSIGSVGGGPTEFFQIRDIDVLPGDRVAVVNGGSDDVRLFSMEGEYIGKFGHRGMGPGEFDRIHWLEVVGDSILTHDWGNDRISVHDANGRYTRSYRMDAQFGVVIPTVALPDRTLLGFEARSMGQIQQTGLVLDSALLARYGPDGSAIDSIGRFAHNQRVVHRSGDLQTTLSLPFSAFGQVTAVGDGFCHIFGVTPEIRCYDLAGTLKQILRVAAEPDPIRPEDIAAYWDREFASTNQVRVRVMHRMRNVMVFPAYFPAYSGLKSDDRGRVWAQTYQQFDAPLVEWRVFDEGRWIARLIVDGAFQLQAIHGNRLVGVWRDELGVESVRVYRLAGS